jgi:hypothetical protein
VALGLIGTGWAIAKAQTPQPTFELQVEAPAGETRLDSVMRGQRANDTAQRRDSRFEGHRGDVDRCSSARWPLIASVDSRRHALDPFLSRRGFEWRATGVLRENQECKERQQE